MSGANKKSTDNKEATGKSSSRKSGARLSITGFRWRWRFRFPNSARWLTPTLVPCGVGASKPAMVGLISWVFLDPRYRLVTNNKGVIKHTLMEKEGFGLGRRVVQPGRQFALGRT